MFLKDFKATLAADNFIKLSVLLFICSSASALVNPFLSIFLSQNLNASASQIGLFVSLNSISGIIISTILGRISDKASDGRIILAIAILAGLIGYILYALITQFYLLLIVSIIFIGLSSVINSQIFVYAKQNFDGDEKSQSKITFLRTFVSIAWVSSPLLGALLDDKLGFNGLFLGTAISYLFSFIILIILFKPKPKEHIEPKKNDVKKDKAYSNKYIIECFIVFTLLQVINTVLNTSVPLYVTENLHYGNAYIGIISSFAAFAEIPFMIILASLSIKFPIKHLINAGIITCLCFLILLLYVNNIYLIIFIHILKAVFVSAYMGIGIAFFQDMMPNRYGTSTTLYTNTTRLGTILGGMVISMFSVSYPQIFVILIIICVLSLIVFNFADEGYKELDTKITK
jgi:MFS transporter, SET family, sugar efflux transporter